MTDLEYLYYRILPTFLGVLILIAFGEVLNIISRRHERRQKQSQQRGPARP
jgi:hypothetical protein